MKTYLAFYKGKGLIGDKLIRLWTRSKYSHVELVIDNVWMSSSMRDGGVRSRKGLVAKSDHWDYLEIDCDADFALKMFESKKGHKYDYLGIALTQFMPLNIHDKIKEFCSEIVSLMLKVEDAHRYSPEDLYTLFTTGKKVSRFRFFSRVKRMLTGK